MADTTMIICTLHMLHMWYQVVFELLQELITVNVQTLLNLVHQQFIWSEHCQAISL